MRGLSPALPDPEETAMRIGPLLAALPLAAAMIIPTAQAAQAVTVPPECDPGFDLTGFNIIIGTDGPDFICGKLGNDRIYGLGGDDIILGDDATFFGQQNAPGGADVIDAGAGNDQVLGGPGDDAVNGGSGDDFIALAVGNDTGQGGQGSDTIIGGFGTDTVIGGPGDDFLDGDLPPDDNGQPTVDPNPNNDRCIGAEGVDTAVLCEVALAVEG